MTTQAWPEPQWPRCSMGSCSSRCFSRSGRDFMSMPATRRSPRRSPTLGYASSLVKTSEFLDPRRRRRSRPSSTRSSSRSRSAWCLGLVLGLQRFAGDVAEPILVALYTIPKITLYPLILLIFGLGVSAKVAFGVIHGVIPIILFTLNAVKNINPVLHPHRRIMRLSHLADGLDRADAGGDAGTDHRRARRLLADDARRADRRDVRLSARPRLPDHQRHQPAQCADDDRGDPDRGGVRDCGERTTARARQADASG